MKKIVSIALTILVLATGCNMIPGSQPPPTATRFAIAAYLPTNTPTNTPTTTPTEAPTSTPTNTPTTTPTEAPTSTPEPPFSPYACPNPQMINYPASMATKTCLYLSATATATNTPTPTNTPTQNIPATLSALQTLVAPRTPPANTPVATTSLTATNVLTSTPAFHWEDGGLFEATFNGYDLGHDIAYTVVPGGLWQESNNQTTMIIVVAPGSVVHLPGLTSDKAWKGHEWRMYGYDASELGNKPAEVKKGSKLDFLPTIIVVTSDADLDKPIQYGASTTTTLRNYGFTYKLHPTQRQ